MTKLEQLKSEILKKLDLPEEMTGNDLKKVREKLGISREEFADEAMWCDGFQSFIEGYATPLSYTGYFDRILTVLVMVHIKAYGE